MTELLAGTPRSLLSSRQKLVEIINCLKLIGKNEKTKHENNKYFRREKLSPNFTSYPGGLNVNHFNF